MRQYLAKAIADLHSAGLHVEHLKSATALPRKLIRDMRRAVTAYDQDIVAAEMKEPSDLPEFLRKHCCQLDDVARFRYDGATYRLGIVDTGLCSSRYKPSGENLEALALVGMIVEANISSGITLGSSCCLTTINEASVLTSGKQIGTELAIINVFYPVGTGAGTYPYDPSDLEQSKAELRKAHQAADSGIENVLNRLGVLGITYFSFETILKAMQTKTGIKRS